MRWFLHDLLNKQVLRAFTFIPAIGWREVPVEEVSHLFETDIKSIGKNDRVSYRCTCDCKMVSFIIVFYANENRKDTNYVNNVLKNAIQKHEKVMGK